MSNKYGKVNNYINGVFVGTITDRWMNVNLR